jgi:hypothetical protein
MTSGIIRVLMISFLVFAAAFAAAGATAAAVQPAGVTAPALCPGGMGWQACTS